MNNNRIEIGAASVLVISFLFFLVSYSNYDLRKKRGWRGEISPITQTAVTITEKQANLVSKSVFLEHSINKDTYRSMITDRNGYRVPEHIVDNREWNVPVIYSQLILRDKTSEENFDGSHKLC